MRPTSASLYAARGVAQPGSALRSGRRGPQFESGHPDASGRAGRSPLCRALRVGLSSAAVSTLRAVVFDVDFTLAKPGPDLGPDGYRRIGERHGLDLDPHRYEA